MGMNVDASGIRTYWHIVPEEGIRLYVYSLKLVAAITGSISSYANFLGVTVVEASQLEIEVYINGTAYSILSDGVYASLGIRSIGDILTAGTLHDSCVSTTPGIVCSSINFQNEASPYGIVLNGYAATAGKTSDSLSISHKADMSGLDYLNVAAQVKRLFLP